MSRYLLLIIGVFALFSCTEADLESPSPARTVLIYMAGNNNLSEETYLKTNNITAGWHNGRDNLLIYLDASGEKKGPSLMKVVGDAANPYTQVIKEYPVTNSASSTVFSGVVQDVLSMYPSSGYGLLIFSHGTGWLPEGMFTTPRSIMNDNGREMEIADFAAALPDHTFDFIVMEACLMSGVEVAYELRHKANYLVASSTEILSPGFTPIYPELINCLFEPEPNLTGFVRCYYDHCFSLQGVYQSGTMSLLDLNAMDRLAAVSDSVFSNPESVQPDIASIQSFDRGRNKLFFDFGDYMEQVNPVMYPAVEAAISKVVLYKAATPLFVSIPIRRHSGLTVYMEQDKYPELNKAYRLTEWWKYVFESSAKQYSINNNINKEL